MSLNNTVIDDEEMYVVKRNTEKSCHLTKFFKESKKIGNEINIKINFTTLAMKVIDQLYDSILLPK